MAPASPSRTRAPSVLQVGWHLAAVGRHLVHYLTLAVMAILALLAVPSMSRYAENAKVHATAELFHASVQQARTEAIRRKAPQSSLC